MGSALFGERRFAVEAGVHKMFTSLEAVVAHREWLKGLKERFLRGRKKLKEDGTRVTR